MYAVANVKKFLADHPGRVTTGKAQEIVACAKSYAHGGLFASGAVDIIFAGVPGFGALFVEDFERDPEHLTLAVACVSQGVPLQRGDVVTDTGDEHTFLGKQGQVIRVYANGTVIVRYPVYMVPAGFYWYDEEHKPVNITYKGADVLSLRKDDHWDEMARVMGLADQRWPRSHHSVAIIPEPFQEGCPCMIEDCPELAVNRALINFVGTVYTVDVCAVHNRQWDGLMTEGFPKLKKR